jgi:Ca2+-binding EF-hand superfamily protein
MDTDASGTINIKELIDFLTAVGGEIDKDEVTDISNMSLKNLYFLFQIREIFLSLDDSGDRLIDFEELKVRSFL